MSTLHTLLSLPFIQQLGWTLLHFIWQGILIGLACGILLRLPIARGARANYTISLGGLLLCAIAPLLTFVAIQPAVTPPALLREPAPESQLTLEAAATEQPDAMRAQQTFATANDEALPAPAQPALFIPAATQLGDTPIASVLDLPDAEETPALRHGQWLQSLAPYVPWLVVLWFPLALLLSLRLGWQWGQTRRWVRSSADCAPLSHGIHLSQLCQRIGVRFPVRLLESAKVAGPLTVGFVKPVILVPVGFLISLAPEHIEAILLHELAHIRRRDFLVNLLTSLVTALLFYHPVVWWLDRRARLARELCCDELAANACSNRATYAHALARLELWRQENLALAMAASNGSLLQRIRALAGQRGTTAPSGRSLASLSAVCALTLTTALLLQFSPNAQAGDEGIAAAFPHKPAPSGVVLGINGKPLAGAMVTLYHMEYFYGLDNGVIQTVESDADGRFAFTESLLYQNRQEAPEREEYYAVASAPDEAIAIAIFERDATSTQDVELRLSRPEVRTVKVTDRDGTPVQGARVNVHSISTDNKQNWAYFNPAFGALETTTDADGLAVFTQLPKGSITFSAQKAGYSPNWSGCNSGKNIATSITLRTGASISGRLTLADGSPASGITVYATPLWPLHDFTPARTDAEGHFTISGLYGKGDAWHGDGGTGEYRIGIADPQLDATPQNVSLASGQSLGDLHLVARSGTLVTGVVLDPASHTPIGDAQIYVSTVGNSFTILSDAKGRFHFRALPGSCEIRFEMPPAGTYVLEYATLSPYPFLISEIIGTHPLSRTLYAPSQVRKLVTAEGRVLAADGKPAAGVTVLAEILTPGRLVTSQYSAQGTRTTKTDAEGYYQLADYPSELPMRLIARGNGGFALTQAPALPVDAPQLADVTLQPAVSVKVRVVDLNGNPLTQQPINYGSYSDGGDLSRTQSVPPVSHLIQQKTTTDQDGFATLHNLSPELPCAFWLANERYSWKRILPQQLAEADLPAFTLSPTMLLRFTDANGTPLHVERAEHSQEMLRISYQRETQIPLRQGTLDPEAIAEGWLETPKKSFTFVGPGAPVRLWVKLKNGQTASVTGVFPQFDNRIHFKADITFRNIGKTAPPFALKEGESAICIIGDDDQPLPQATVQIVTYNHEPTTINADAGGWCLIPASVANNYNYIQVNAAGHAPEWITDLTAGEIRTVSASQKTRLKGRLTTPEGNPPGKTQIEMRAMHKGRTYNGYYSMREIPYTIETDEEGNYDAPVSPGLYSARISSESGHFLSLKDFAIAHNQTASLPPALNHPAQLELILTDSVTGKPAEGARFSLLTDTQLFVNFEAEQKYLKISDAEGRIKWESLPPWTVGATLRPRAVPNAPPSPYLRSWSEKDIHDGGKSALYRQRPPIGEEGFSTIQLDLKPGEQTIPVTVEKGIHVSGKVLLPESLPEEGRIIIVAVPENQSLSSDYVIKNHSIIVDRATGKFSGWVPAGNGLPHRICAHYWSDSRDPSGYLPTALSEAFDSKPGDAFTFELSMQGGGWLTGRLTDAEGNPLAGEMVITVPDNRAAGTYDFSRAITDAEGRFTIGPIRASNYGITLPQYLMAHDNSHKMHQHDTVIHDGETTNVSDIHFAEQGTERGQ